MLTMKEIEDYNKNHPYDYEDQPDSISLRILDQGWMDKVQEFLDTVPASDCIETDFDTISKLRHLWTEEEAFQTFGSIPNDIFLSNTIPITSLEFLIKDGVPSLPLDTERGQTALRFRVDIVDKEDWEVRVVDGDDLFYVGSVCVYFGTSEKLILFSPIVLRIEDGVTFLPWIHEMGFVGDGWTMASKRMIAESVTGGHHTKIMSELLSCWYSTQIAMLHPQLKEVVLKVKGKQKRKVKDATSGVRKTCYVKTHYITEGEVDRVLESHERIYKCPAWYVTGHYRTYSSGKTGWVRGYWKGVLRDTKMNHDDGRIREVEIGHLV